MKIGRKFSLMAAVAAGVCSAGAAALVPALGLSGATLIIGVAALTMAVVAAVVFPIGYRHDHQTDLLINELTTMAESRRTELIETGSELQDLRTAIQQAMDSLSARAEEAESNLREVEIRHQVSEAERQHIEAILHSLHDAVLVTDAFNELKMANDRAGELLGFRPAEAMHKSIDDIIVDDALRRLIQDERDLATPGHRKHADHAIPSSIPSDDPESQGMCYDVTLTCLPDSRRGVGGVVTILRDVTREREISQMKTDFVSKVSHELRTPLSSINAYIELLLDGEAADEESRQEFYQIIKSEADRLNRLIDNMLNISRIEAGIVKIERTEVDFISASKKAIEVIQPQANLKEISVHLKSSPLACTAMADADMVHQVLLNLLSNAVKYTPEGGRVTVAVENDDATGSVMVTVADTGLGIPPDSLDKVFDKFYRIENYKRVAKGTGLGLSLVKHIVETVHNGHISVTSELGMGSKFRFNIPYDADGA
ncbi:MAG: PAS domain-containing protein [Phycisphaeraceae bacterium]|nr:MAG: PAS domain-containing protein [Phycisphaeraceae bacterium]